MGFINHHPVRILIITFFVLVGSVAAQQFGLPEKNLPNRDDREYDVRTMVLNEEDLGFDVLHYRLDLDFSEDLETFDGRITALFKVTTTSIDEVFFHAVDLEIDTISFYGDIVQPVFTEQGFTVQLEQTFVYDDTFSVSVKYRGAAGDRGYMNYEVCAFTFCEPEDARRWFPCYDVPWDKATAEINVTVPVGVDVASVGLLHDRKISLDGMKETFYWKTEYQVATYLFCVTMSPYYARWSDWYVTSEGDSIEMPYYIFEWDSANAVFDTHHMVDGMEFFSETFGPYPFEKYGTAEEDPAPFGGMEHQTMTTINSRWVTGTRSSEYGLIHELAHMWWGDAVTLNEWPSIWLNEGFAVYSEALFFEDYMGTPWLHGKMAYCEQIYFDRARSKDFPIYDPGFAELFNWGIIYNKGAWVLHMLRHVVGDTNFFQIIKDYYAMYKYGNASISGFQNVCETVSGMELSWFFMQWIYDEWVPEIDYSWESRMVEGGLYEIILRIEQVQERGPAEFRMPLDLRIKGGEIATVDTMIWIGEGEDYYRFVVDFNPSEVVLDPENWILMLDQNVPMIYLRSDEVPETYTVIQNFPNPFNDTTTIYYDIRSSIVRYRFILSMSFNDRGQRIRTLVDSKLEPGEYWAVWDGRDDAGNPVSSGVYIILLDAEGIWSQVKTVLLR